MFKLYRKKFTNSDLPVEAIQLEAISDGTWISDDDSTEEPLPLTDGILTESMLREAKALDAAGQTSDRIPKVADQYKNCTPEQVAGRIAEETHAGNFNINAARRGRSDVSASTTASNGNPHAPADIEIVKNGKVTGKVQVKYNEGPAKNTFEISDPKYDGMQKVVPADQTEKVKSLATKRGVDATGRKNYPDTAVNTSGQIEQHGVKSKPLSYAKAQEMAKDPVKAAKDIVNGEVGNAVKSGTITGAACSGIFSVADNVKAAWKGDKKAKQAAGDVVKDTLKGSADGAAKSAVTVAATKALTKAGLKGLAKGAGPGAIAVTGVEVAKDAYKACTGEMDGAEFGKKTAKNALRCGTSWGGAEGGAALGTLIMPGLGTVIGGIIGGIAGSILPDLIP